MPSVPVTYSNASPTESSSTLESLLHDNEASHLSGPVNTLNLSHLSKRPPLPPYALKRPASRELRVHQLDSSSTRSPSPCSLSSNLSYRSRSLSTASGRPRSRLDSLGHFSTPPRRIYPLENVNLYPSRLEDGTIKEQAPVVFDASLNFVLGCDMQRVRQSFRPTASHLEPTTASSYLSEKISQFLKRTDHVMDEWRSLGHKNEADNALTSLPSTPRSSNASRNFMGRSQSATNIMIRGFQYYSRADSVARGCSSRRSLSRASEDRTMSDSIGHEVYKLSLLIPMLSGHPLQHLPNKSIAYTQGMPPSSPFASP